MAKKENLGIRIIICVALLGIILASVPIFLSITEEPTHPAFLFSEHETVPEDALIVLKLTETDYEKYPVLRNIPEPIYVDRGSLSDIYTRPGYLDKNDVRDFANRYGSSSTYIEHNGRIYHLLHVAVLT
ncbi:MAG TPA: hypothetical protein O0W80_05815 [Methanocorpusculum sp.]|nr:hypothetical protein [Methanocorpusculum sp.]HJJ76629.1 hypothetical protein [Methanocorpusculum sp.]